LINPEPISDFFDLFALGEGEEVIPEFLEAYRRPFRRGGERKRTICLKH